MAVVDTGELDAKVRQMYRQVAERPHGAYHFEMGRPLADRLGYPDEVLDRIPRRRSSPSRGSATSSTSPASARGSG